VTSQGTDDHAPDGDALGWALHQMAVATAAVDSVIARRLGVSSTEYLALKHILAAEPAIGPVELGRLLGMSSGSATALVDRLERSGHLERVRHPSDRRRLVLAATTHARERILAQLQPLTDEMFKLSRRFTPAERDATARFLTLLAEQYGRHRT
jgi:DNA-binding MarR family transcriptional regulator